MSSVDQRDQGEERLIGGGRYALIDKIGEGGLGTVWRAQDRTKNRLVAIKELTLSMAMLDSQLEVYEQRIRREIGALLRLSGHPNIVAILDQLWEDGHAWIVMEHVPGESLQQVIDREGRIPPWRAAGIGAQVLDALRAAHAGGILHRDVKPSNILLAEGDRAVLTDFGIAQIHGSTSLTVTGQVVGSPGYIAPEQLNGESASQASDLWSLGATLYTAVEGHMPYVRDSVVATLNAMMIEPVPPPRNAGPLETMLMGLLEREPARRTGPDEAARILARVAATAPGALVIDGLEVTGRIDTDVWRARDEDGADLSVKLLPTGSDLVQRARPLAEAPIDGVVRVREVGELADGRPYIVMGYADRGPLAQRMGGDPARALRLTVEVARQVAAVNKAGGHYARLNPWQILFESAEDGGERLLLPIPDPAADRDVQALGVLAHRMITGTDPRTPDTVPLLGADEASEVLRRAVSGGWPDADAFADALEPLIESAPLPRFDAPPELDAPQTQQPRPPTHGAPPLPGPPDVPAHDEPLASSVDRRYVTQDESLARRPRPRPARPRGAFRRRVRPRRKPPPAWEPVTGPRHSAMLYTPLREEFRYVHEPLRLGDTAIPLIGNERHIQALKERLVNSYGGTFLVTGFRGVGKSTLIGHALAEIDKAHPRGRRVLPVVLSVARPLETERLLFAIVRRVFEELTEAGVLEDLPSTTRQSLVRAYMRTSLSFKETRADAAERTASLDFDAAKLARGMLNPAGLVPKAGMSTKRSRSLATEAAFLAYSETDVEHDMTRIITMLSEPAKPRVRRRRRRRTPLDLQLVVVLDEVDKLTALQDGLDTVERLLSGIKNVVTMRGAHYLVVAGPDLHDRVLRDSGRGNSIYESIFAWRMYVPCNWSAPARLLEELCLTPVTGGVIAEFEKYLRYKSRGVLRRLLQELNSFVVWEESRRPYLQIGARSHDAISFYARLETSLDAFFVATRRQVPPTPLDQDRWRLGAYYVMDWILRSEGRPFTSADVIQAVADEEFDPLLRVSQAGVELLLEHLAAHGVLTVVREPNRATSTLIPDVVEAQRPSYKLDDSLLDRLFGILAHNEDEWAEIDPGRSTFGAAGRTAPIETLSGDRYELWRLIGEGGTSSVYEGRDTLLHRPIAVKMLRTALRGDPRARSRFLREAMIAGAVHHPNVVDVYEVVTVEAPEDPGGRRYAIVMELIEGLTLDQTIVRNGPLPARQVAQLGITLAGALEYLAGKGLARLDLKPHNIVLSPARGPVIIDLGIAKIVENAQAWLVDSDGPAEPADPPTQLGIVIGTPAYLSPEQARGEEVDARSDIYALGLVLCTCLAGRHPYQELDPVAVMARAMLGGLETSGLPCSPELRAVLARATRREPAERYDPAGLLAALRGTPEARGKVTASP